jgi:hypothetical protein
MDFSRVDPALRSTMETTPSAVTVADEFPVPGTAAGTSKPEYSER